MTYIVDLPKDGAFDAWRAAARRAIALGAAPAQVDWTGRAGLFGGERLPAEAPETVFAVPKRFVEVARTVSLHAAETRFDLLYQALWRLHRSDGDPLSPADPLGRKLDLMAKSVRRDIHKMHAFVRFRETPSAGPRRSFVAWFEPDHDILEAASGFFVKRFFDMDWTIATPRRTARFKDGDLEFAVGAARPDLPEDASAELWGAYFANIFNPARVKLRAMTSEMPKKYWANLPETRLIPGMLADAEARVARMRAAGAKPARPGAGQISQRYRAQMPQAAERPGTLEEAKAAAMQCRRCGLCEMATQTVWGEGPAQADVMIVGEQPGDEEDLVGRPFVGPAGQVLRGALDAIGADQKRIYFTNAVKHFKFKPSGKRRLHATANRSEIQHCRWWLAMEIEWVRPRLIVALGATAAASLTGGDGPIAGRRGAIEQALEGPPVLVTWHPAYLLRARDPQQRRAARDEFAEDLRSAFGAG